jgi:DNA-binding XRE family transcriptional regulator
LPITMTFKGQTQTFALELDPDVLYENSQLIRQIDPISIGSLFRKARLEAGLSQEQVASNSGTTRHYISRIENEQSGIQFDTFQKIIELGLGRKVKFEIV